MIQETQSNQAVYYLPNYIYRVMDTYLSVTGNRESFNEKILDMVAIRLDITNKKASNYWHEGIKRLKMNSNIFLQKINKEFIIESQKAKPNISFDKKLEMLKEYSLGVPVSSIAIGYKIPERKIEEYFKELAKQGITKDNALKKRVRSPRFKKKPSFTNKSKLDIISKHLRGELG